MSGLKPGDTLGILGGGQLGRMLILAGRPLGLKFVVLEPKPDSPAGQVADRQIIAAYDDPDGLRRLGDLADVVTLEFENIPVAALEALADRVPLRPGPNCLHICQNRAREKAFLAEAGAPLAAHRLAGGPEELRRALDAIGRPCVVKSAAFGYDGKGQVRLGKDDPAVCEEIWERLGNPDEVVVESWIHFEAELSVVCARGADGQSVCLPVFRNVHRDQILHTTTVPAKLPAAVEAEARSIACRLAEALELVGLLTVEFFLTPDHRLMVNELAPRPHNSGHLSIEACSHSQFDLHLRAVAGWPLPAPRVLQPAVMTNLLGDLWPGNGEPDWAYILNQPEAHLHLYGKDEARPGRKMGHATWVGEKARPLD
ncbi:MAG: 5-(carboxyamino)imidazole ribonucleotide synthase [Opitutales bacterium]